ncbi:M15 family metallopeptidase [Paenibacillus koleovorans]|uniref:M15 family metallopeptidase n=1 Tax=Paenibacillus koleovorans TaxID=121608 RepID=UPI000FDBB654|nr:M15 family metallopeptidase [Paenibacillus koleovorans]
MNKLLKTAAILLAAAAIGTGCGTRSSPTTPTPTPTPSPSSTSPAPSASPSVTPTATATPSPTPAKTPAGTKTGDAIQVVAAPESITALVNKQFKLPDSYAPKDLVYPEVAFIFSEKIEKRKLRQEAATALEQLFAGAKKDNISLAGVSAYRSHATQKSLFESYVKRDGEAKAKTYSAVPGHSEHETGLAIDVSGSSGKCAAEDCFAGTPEAKWLEAHVHEYGFIIRYPKGKESITGYQYEPWHIRFVGKQVAKDIASRGITMEEYYNALPVSQ